MTNQPASDSITTLTDVERIIALADANLRNLQITQSYHELAVALAARTGTQANWCTFAIWASRQAGQTIRKEDITRTLENILHPAPAALAVTDITTSAQALGSRHSPQEMQETVADVLNPLAAFDRVSDAVGRGNKKVYEEIGRAFAHFCATCLHDEAFDAQKIAAFCQTLRSGEPPDGQDYLRRAFQRYYQAFFESDAKSRAELILLANIEIGFHEQTCLQPEILEAMNAPIADPRQLRARLIKAIFPYRGWLARLRLFFLRVVNHPSPFNAALDALLAEARRHTRLLITEYLMTIGFPHGVRLRLGADLPAEFPPSLKEITLADLRAFLDQYDPTPDDLGGTGTLDWSQLPQRLHFIMDMFRCYHEKSVLFDPPFTAEQVAALKAGRLPEGTL